MALEDEYDVAQVCLNGHAITSMALEYPQFKADFCDQCGVRTIMSCPSCDCPIRGDYHGGVIGFNPFIPPPFCIACGRPFPWTAKKMEVAKELLDELDIDPGDLVRLHESLEGLASSSTEIEEELYGRRIKKVIAGLGKSAGSVVYKVAMDFGSETVKKILTGP
ncbi:MAG: DUF2321 domain-containing protein [Thermoleophilia bacterium]